LHLSKFLDLKSWANLSGLGKKALFFHGFNFWGIME